MCLHWRGERCKDKHCPYILGKKKKFSRGPPSLASFSSFHAIHVPGLNLALFDPFMAYMEEHMNSCVKLMEEHMVERTLMLCRIDVSQ